MGENRLTGGGRGIRTLGPPPRKPRLSASALLNRAPERHYASPGGLSSSATPRPRTRFAMVSPRSRMIHGRSISTRTTSPQHLDPAGDPLPHCRRRKVQGVPFPAVIEPAEKSIELGPKTDDAAVEPAPRL